MQTLYPKAPIVEAVFDIQVTSETDLEKIDPDIFLKIHPKIEKEFPIVKTIFILSGQFHFGNPSDVKTKSESESDGKMFSSIDLKRHIQMKKNGFTFNMQAPYTNWEDFSKQAYSYFDLYREVINIRDIVRISLRYVNQILIPLPINKFEDVIKCVPPIPKGFPTLLSSYFMQIQIPFKEEKITAIITQSTLKETESNLPFVLDIDMQNTETSILNDIKPKFERLRTLKNAAFENSLTDTAKKLFI